MTIKTRTPVKSAKLATKSTAKNVAKAVQSSKPINKANAPTPVSQPITPAEPVTKGAQMTQSVQSPEEAGANQSITGRGVFAVRTLGDAVSVEAAFLVEDGNVLRLPAVFPNREYALEQINELRDLINRHFDELAQGKS